jgi:hypothetical protein
MIEAARVHGPPALSVLYGPPRVSTRSAGRTWWDALSMTI